MKFEVINEKNETVMSTTHIECIPSKERVNNLIRDGYKIKVNNKILTKKGIEEFLTERNK